MKITYENSWEYTDIHIDLPVPYEDNYQMRMLRANEIPGLAPVKGSGRDGSSRYTYRIRSGISIGKKYETGEMKKEDVHSLLDALLQTAEALQACMLSPDGLILTPEMIYSHGGKYQFCYLPAAEETCRVPLCRSFHTLTEYFVGRLDYHDTEGIFLVYRLHKETMKESYELRQIGASRRCGRKRTTEENRRKQRRTGVRQSSPSCRRYRRKKGS